MKQKKIVLLFVLFLVLPLLTACGSEKTDQNAAPENKDSSARTSRPENSAINEESAAQTKEGEDAYADSASDSGQNNKKFNGQFPMTIDKTKTYGAVLKTGAGDIEIALAADKTPITVNNFVNLAKKNFYDNTVFHRAIKGFMIQGGDPNGDGTGGPGYRFDDEPFEGEYSRGTVAMANSGANTNGSQFFIMHADTPLPKNYVIFGKVTGGMDAVDKIASAEVTQGPSGEMSKPIAPVMIEKVEIIEK
jgi:cyclophilin family peptidyl-prolyl cis-trans isomerase